MGYRARRGMILLAVALLVGAVAAFTYTEAIKLQRKPVGKVRVDHRLSPGCDCPRETARIGFDLREAERIDVVIANRDGDEVRVLASDLRQPEGRRVVLTWDGRDDAGAVVPHGTYRVRVRLRDERRTVVIPEGIRVTRRAPS
jgi:FlgD Ig-like domain